MQPPPTKSNPLPHATGTIPSTKAEEPKYVHADLEMGTSRFKDVAVRLKGNISYSPTAKAQKPSFKVDLNEFVKGQKLGSLTKLNFHNNAADPSWMNEVLSYQLYRDAGVPAPRTAYAKIYVTVPGEHNRTYLGLYSMVEDVDKPFATEHFGSKKAGIFKPETPKPFDYLGENWASYKQLYNPKAEVTDAQTQRLIDFCKLVAKADDKEFESKIETFLNLDEFSRFLSVTVYLSTLDSLLGMGQNFYMHLHPVSQTFQFVPWDMDKSFGQFQVLGTQEQREQLSILKPWVGENRFLERLFKVAAFQTRYKTHLQSFQATLFKPERFQQQVDSVAAAIRQAVQEESPEKLAQLDRAIAGETVAADAVGPRHGGAAGRYLKPIKAFVKLRSVSVSEQLSGRSKGQEIERLPGTESH
jgi:spore coat protein H